MGLTQRMRDVWTNPMMRNAMRDFGEEVSEGYRRGLGKSIFAPKNLDYSGMNPRQIFANEIGGVAGDVVGQGTRMQWWRYNHPLALAETGFQAMGRASGLNPTAVKSLTGVAVAAPFLLNDGRGKGVHFPEREWDTEAGRFRTADPTKSRAPMREAVLNSIGWSGPLLPYEQFAQEVPGVSEERHKQYRQDMSRKGGGKAGYWLADNVAPVAAITAGAGALLGGVGMAKKAGRLGQVADAAIAAAKKVGIPDQEFFEAAQVVGKAERAAKVARSQVGRQAVMGAGLGALAAPVADTALASGMVRLYDKPVGPDRDVPTVRFAGFETPLPRSTMIVGGVAAGLAAAAIAGPRISERLRRAASRAGSANGVRAATQVASPRSSAIPNQAGAPPPGTPYPFDLPY